ncbi:urease accessory protein UreD [Sphaeroforma arctica JP610]|uniref:Urease accessory protein UreD n=1 Tax=Sphaeroforma arctica JP610 TaxID=667725 RepID=A0A0L0FJ45_9EUKA|nr:urease accessory protein UreD [Sphaeroforma arctica JP610]KNC76780.1 urease accessory protein UreD [Sphaeroforma arctica JP610]|eukprot:XP_014150682.1 urease accessory protein UreD [Sphaeroforma arctica JP610]
MSPNISDNVFLNTEEDLPSSSTTTTGGYGTGSISVKRGNTNIFKSNLSTPVLNTMVFNVAKNATLCWLPHPVTAYKNAKYVQRQEVHMADDSASIILLDWFTSGRMRRGEHWAFDTMSSFNELRQGPRRRLVMRECLALENNEDLGLPSVADRMGAFACYGVLLLLGPNAQTIITSFNTACAPEDNEVAKPGKPPMISPTMLLSVTPWGKDGAIVRIASETSAEAQAVLQKYLAPGVQEFAGDFPWKLSG